MNITKQIALERKFALKYLLPDTCKIYPLHNGRTQDHGIITSTTAVAARQWHGITTIPCRIDLSRAFRPDRLKQQATEVDEYNLELPIDLVFDPSDYVVFNKDGVDHRFEIRKVKNLSKWDVTIECIVDVAGVEIF